jgi:hypothetical protein
MKGVERTGNKAEQPGGVEPTWDSPNLMQRTKWEGALQHKEMGAMSGSESLPS